MQAGSQSRGLAYLVLAVGVLVAATSSILIRYAQQEGMPSLVIAAGRLLIATMLLALVFARSLKTDLPKLSRRDVLMAGVSGVFLALHFASWVSSLLYTSVASSAALVTTNPIWVGLLSYFVLKERVTGRTMLGIGLSLAGSLVILATGEVSASAPAPLLGNALALFGAMTVSGYFLAGRSLKDRVALPVYLTLVNAFCTVVLLLAAGVELIWLDRQTAVAGVVDWRAGLGSSLAWLCVLGLALGPQLIGHGAFNWSLRRLSATFVALSILGEPVGSAVFAWLLFGESISVMQGLGFMLLLAGIAIGARGEPDAEPQSAKSA